MHIVIVIHKQYFACKKRCATSFSLMSHMSKFCFVFLKGSRLFSSQTFYQFNLIPTIPHLQFTGLQESSEYTSSRSCCNSEGCSLLAIQVLTTKLAPPKITGEVSITNVTNTTAVLHVPSVDAGDAKL